MTDTQSSKKAGRLSVGIVGSDVVGVSLGKALAAAGHIVVGVSSVADAELDVLEAMLPKVRVYPITELLALSDLILLALPASEIAATVSELASAKSFRAGQLVVHTASQYSHEILSEATALGSIPLAISPAMRFTGTSLDLGRMRESYFAVSAPVVALPIAQALVIEMGAEPIIIEDSQREKYAEAIEVASGFSGMIVSQAIGLLEQAGVLDPSLIIAPVVRSSVEEALSKGHREINPKDLLGDK